MTRNNSIEPNKKALYSSVRRFSYAQKEDNIGLHAEAETGDPEVRAAAEKGLLRGWSFGMINPAAQWTDAGNGIRRRTIEDMELVEVSLLAKTPAYFGTSVEMRSSELSSWETERNQNSSEILWHFNSRDAREKLISIYPVISSAHSQSSVQFY